jgi:hypothetical protein
MKIWPSSWCHLFLLLQVPFSEIRDVILGLFFEQYGLQIRDVQKCPFGPGQAYVRFARISDRDGLIAHSPHHLNGFNLEVTRHNRGTNVGGLLSTGNVG